MSINIVGWRTVLRQIVAAIADEEFQRQTWFGGSHYIFGPDEAFNSFLGDAATEAFLERDDTGLDEPQMEAGRKLLRQMTILCDATPNPIDPYEMIDDPRWQEIRQSAAHFSALLEASFGEAEPLDGSGNKEPGARAEGDDETRH